MASNQPAASPSPAQTTRVGSPVSSSSIEVDTSSPPLFDRGVANDHGHATAAAFANPNFANIELVSRTIQKPRGKSIDQPYHIFSRCQKWHLVYLVSIAGSFSPLSSNIYFPAIDTISSELHIGPSLVALTITIYMIVQALSPSLWGPISDMSGRRVTLAATLVIYSAANFALAFTSNFAMLLGLRGLQAFGSAATISISAGVIADIANPGERGGFMGVNAGTRMIGQAAGPVFGGLLNSKWGFRSIFWLLFVQSIIVLMVLLVFLPETQRKIAGNGSTPLHGFHKPWLYYIFPPREWPTAKTTQSQALNLPRISFKQVLVPFKYLLQKDVFVLLSWGSLIYTIWSMMTSSTTTVLLHSFPSLTQWQIGLCFLPNGLGCILGSVCTGMLLDRTFKSVEKKYKEEHDLPATMSVHSIPDFPYERARLRFMPYFSLSFIISVALYGPSFELNDLRRYYAANLVASLGLQFMIAFTATAIFNINSTMLVPFGRRWSERDSANDRGGQGEKLFFDIDWDRCIIFTASLGAVEILWEVEAGKRSKPGKKPTWHVNRQHEVLGV
ncbi:hypothetical protein QQS21_005248 [Conoideocrella luteorostrata]|uniref:Major facilitator superfamily (MFS) profile domain-containing protein n=1 Tax=Conoideocrella luteorostrata TaxID=1105319 RepID=A0AAJ0FUN4_9HYPO|nr:hypothetical protein QQS21_005248 [Conoideocrella luteorostrata]